MDEVWDRARDIVADVAVAGMLATHAGAAGTAVQQASTGATVDTLTHLVERSNDFRAAAEEGAGARTRADEVAEQTEGLDEPDSGEYRDPPDGAVLDAADHDAVAHAAQADLMDADDADVADGHDAADAAAVGEAGGL